MTRVSDFDYDLPQRMIAQTPAEPRDAARLLVLHRGTGVATHRIFRELGDYLHKGDLLVLNQTRVIPARLFARKPTGGKVELLLLRKWDSTTWSVLVGGKLSGVHSTLRVDGGPQAEILEVLEGAERIVRFAAPIENYLNAAGHVPLPPYIHEQLRDPERYQTVYAVAPGSAAAPTAGLHFTPGLLTALQSRGIRLGYVTLHVGLDTFAPVTESEAEVHKIHTEWCELPPATARLINQTRQEGRRVIAVGTTSARTLETAARESQPAGAAGVAPFSGDTDLYVLPGFRFQLVDALITNFHLPKSTLLMMVCAFAGRELVLGAYEEAKLTGYRFYSFGDAMLIL